jgi:hypothetical protein
VSNTGFQGKYRRGTSFNVSFPTMPSFSTQPRRIDIHQKQYHHDVLIMEFSTFSSAWFEMLKTGVPVTVSWSQENYKNTFLGYVSHISRDIASQRENLMQVHCVAASFPFKQRTTRVFKNSSIPEAISTICRELGFGFTGENHGRKFDQLTLAGHSYWEWIVEHAKKIGYGVLVEGTNLSFRPLDKFIDTGVSNIPVLTMQGMDLQANSQFLDRTLDKITVLHGEHIEDAHALRANKLVGGVDPLTSKTFTSSKKPNKVGTAVRSTLNDVLFDEQRTEQVINNKADASIVAEGHAHMGRLNMPARIKGQGDPRIAPFKPVYIQGTGDFTDGYWVVKEVKHIMYQVGDYQIEALLVTDGVGKNQQSIVRRTDAGIVGAIDLATNIASSSKTSGAFKKKTSQLNLKTAIVLQAHQGYNRTPAVWKQTNASPRKAR